MTATTQHLLVEALRRCGMTIATAESCTGGNIAHLITSVAGCSDVMTGGVVAYSNAVKTGVLGVNPADIERCGAVSETVVRQMATGAMRVCGASMAVATSGIAGPGGATPGKPVGTVCMAVATSAGAEAWTSFLPGDRASVIELASQEVMARALEMLLTRRTPS